MNEIINSAWGQFAAIAAGVAVVAGLIGNVGKITDAIKKRLESRRKRLAAPSETLALVRSMQTNIAKLEGNMTNVITKVNAIENRLDDVTAQVSALQKSTDEQSTMLSYLDADTADLLASQLTREHDYYINKGFCPTVEKERIGKIYGRYKNRGRNHIADHLMDDLLNLPIS